MADETPNQRLDASLTPRGTLENVARRPPIAVTAEDSLSLKDIQQVEGTRAGDVFVVRKETLDGRTTAVDHQDDGSATTVTTGHMRSKKNRETEACMALVQYLNDRGAHWVDFVHTGESEPELGYDCMAKDGTQSLFMQHTQAHHDSRLSRDLAHGALAYSGSPLELAKDLWLAIERKLPSADPLVTLVLDATDLGAHALPVTVRAFLDCYGPRLQSLRFKETWLVGPSTTLIYRLG